MGIIDGSICVEADINIAEALDKIGVEAVVEYFGEEEALDYIGEDSAIEHFGLEKLSTEKCVAFLLENKVSMNDICKAMLEYLNSK